MNKQLILHIPHTDTTIPDKTGYLLSDAALKHEQLVLTDWYTDELYHSDEDIVIKAEFSRIFCDVERFADDELEVRSRIGMGALST
jgi:N-formylglutamate amidohydrolase